MKLGWPRHLCKLSREDIREFSDSLPEELWTVYQPRGSEEARQLAVSAIEQEAMTTHYRVIGPESWHTEIAKCHVREGNPGHVAVNNAYIVPLPGIGSIVVGANGRIVSASRTTRRSDPIEAMGSPQLFRRLGECEAASDSRTCVFLGPLFPHYGHFLLESLSRSWYEPEQDSVFAFAVPNVEIRAYMLSIWKHLGFDLDKFLFISVPTHFNRIIVPEPAFRVGRHVFTCMRDVYAKIARSACSEPPVAKDRIYLSRSRWENTRNEEELERALAAEGFRIVHPQDLSIEEQVATMRGATEIVGRWGSAMHNVVFAPPGVKILHLFADRLYTSYYLTDQLARADATYVIAEPGAPRGRAKIDIDKVLKLVKTI